MLKQQEVEIKDLVGVGPVDQIPFRFSLTSRLSGGFFMATREGQISWR